MAAKARAPSLRVRLVNREDAAALVPLFEAFYGTYFGEPVVEGTVARRLRQVESFETVVVAEGGGRLLGFASLRVTPSLDPTPYAEMTELFVEADSRRLGVASRLVKYLEGLAKEQGATHMVVLTGRMNTEAQTFYRNAGYEQYAVAMRKSLRAPGTP